MSMRLLRLKKERWLEWAEVLGSSYKGLNKVGRLLLLRKILWLGLFVGLVSGVEYRRRLLRCGRCVVYDRSRRVCGRGGVGCGCYMPVKSLSSRSICWGDDVKIRHPLFTGWEKK